MTELSLVVCTRNRAPQLRRTLEAVDRIESDRSWELVLVENACTDHTSEVVDTFVERASVSVSRVEEPAPGKSRALNTGIRESAGRVIATTDDDCYPTASYVDDVGSLFDRYDLGFLGGRMLLYDQSDAPLTVLEREEKEWLPAHTFPKTGFVGGGNLAFLREVFDDVGGFDPLLGPGTPFIAEDIDFVARASDAGWVGGYFPGPTVYHHHGRKHGKAVDDRMRAYDLGRGAYYIKTFLGCPSLSLSALKWWYWDLDIARQGQTRREIEGALRYCWRRGIRSVAGLLP